MALVRTWRSVSYSREGLAHHVHLLHLSWLTKTIGATPMNSDGSITIPANIVDQWIHESLKAFEELSEADRDAALVEADSILAVIGIT